MYPIPLNEHLIENKVCKQCQTIFPITDKDMEFYEKVSPTFGIPQKGGSRSETEVGGLGLQESQFSDSTPSSQLLSQGASRKYLIPPPTLCPDCRIQRRLSWHNERSLYKRKCDATGKDIVSIYSPDKPYTVYHQDYWWSDKWDPMTYGREFDFRKNFFEQWDKFYKSFPKQALIAKDCENSDYVNFVWKVENSYLISAASFDQECYYGNRVTKSKNCVDTFLVKESENCYSCIDVNNSYNCRYSEKLSFCRDCEFCIDCEGCTDCILSINLRNKKYCIQNKEYTKEEYFRKKEELKRLPIHEFLGIQKEEFANIPRREGYLLNSENSFGNAIRNARDATYVFDGDILENVKYSAFVDDVSDAYDINYGYGETSLQYESLGTGEKSYGVLFSINVWPDISHMIYCDTCTGCHYCFGCTGLRNKSYCILNKQYTKEEYEKLVPQIIEKMMIDGEWGEFFPASMSPFGYNETVANEYYPLSREEVLGNLLEKGGAESKGRSGGLVSGEDTNQKPQSSVSSSLTASKSQLLSQGAPDKTFLHGPIFNWSDYEAPFPQVEKVIDIAGMKRLPDDISKIPDDILSWALTCEVSGKPFRIIKQELEFYRKHNLPIPRRHPDVRHLDRMKMRNPRKLFERLCDCERCEENHKAHLLSFSVGESVPERFSQSENDKRQAHTQVGGVATFGIHPKTGKPAKKMITTYAPERKEKVYCEVCYEKEVVG